MDFVMTALSPWSQIGIANMSGFGRNMGGFGGARAGNAPSRATGRRGGSFWLRLIGPYVRRRNRPARTRSRNCVDFSVAGAGFRFGFALAVAVCFAALRAASLANCLVANSFASASTGSAGAPSRVKR